MEDLHILEVGSYIVNDTIRQFLPQKNYIGVDLTEGPGVDVVGDGHALKFDDAEFDLAISCEVFEHNPFWKETFRNMYRMTKPGGFIVFTCVSTGRLEHGTKRSSPQVSPGTQAIQWNYYRNLAVKDFGPIVSDLLFEFISFSYNKVSQDLYFVGRKKCAIDEVNAKVFAEKDFLNYVNPAFSKSPAQRGVRGFFREIYRLPIDISCKFCDEKSFQSFAVNYQNAVFRVRRLMNKLVS